MKPLSVRKGGPAAVLRHAVGSCSLGSVLVAASDRGIAAILLGDDKTALEQDLERRFPTAQLVSGDKAFERLVARAVISIERPKADLDLALDIHGTAFQHRVWQALRSIPVGETASYAEIARRIGRPKATRAVAQACAANPLAIAIPCHRVVGSDGRLTGYRWGVERKEALLAREAQRKTKGRS